jgi:hypothetical protein
MEFKNIETCPRGRQVLLLGKGGVPTISSLTSHNSFWIGWAPIPDIPLEIRELQFQPTLTDSDFFVDYDERFD